MITYKKISVYLPEELYQILISYQEQRRFEAASDTVVEILSQFFQKDNEVKRYATIEQMEVHENQVAHLTKQVAQLYQIIASSAPTTASITISPESRGYPFESTSFEEVDDEPDEILHDFLE
jgi:hypothetical protein